MLLLGVSHKIFVWREDLIAISLNIVLETGFKTLNYLKGVVNLLVQSTFAFHT